MSAPRKTQEELYQQFLDHLSHSDPVMHQLAKDAGNLLSDNTTRPLFVRVVAQIIGQRISFKFARKLRGALFTRLGTQFSPDDLLAVGLSGLEEMGIPGPQASTLVTLASRVIAGFSLQPLDRLQDIKGIGPWTISCLKASDPLSDQFPEGDLVLRRGIQALYGPSADLASLRACWSPYGSLVCQYLWAKFNRT